MLMCPEYTLTVSVLYISYSLLGGSISDVCEVGSYLVVDDDEALAVLTAQSCLLILVDPLVKEDGQPLPLDLRSGCVAKVVLRYLGDVIRGIGHTWMIGQVYMMIWAGPGGRPPMRGV